MFELTGFSSQFAIDLVIGFSIVGCCVFTCSIPYILYRDIKRENAEDAAKFEKLNEVIEDRSDIASSSVEIAISPVVAIEKDVLEEGKPKEFPSFGKGYTFQFDAEKVGEKRPTGQDVAPSFKGVSLK